MKRIVGIVLVAVAVISLLISLVGLIEIWAMRQPLTEAAVAGLDLFTDTLDTTSEALSVTQESLRHAGELVTTFETTALTAAQTLSNTRVTLGSFSGLMSQDLTASIISSRAALRSAQSSAVIVDAVLTSLSRFPLFNVQYNPAVPLSVALGEVAGSLDNLPSTFSTIERNLNDAGNSLEQVVKSLNELPRTTQDVRRDIASTQKVIGRYQSELKALKEASTAVKASLPLALTFGALALSFLILWLSVAQLQVLLKGLELLKGDNIS